MQTYLGIEIGGTKLQLVLGDEHGQIVQHIRRTVDKAKGALGIRQQIEAAILELTGRQSRPQAVGVGFGGPVDWQTGAICRSHQIEGWSQFDFAGWLRRTIDVPVFLDNDANVAALGEATYGAGQGCNPVFYVTLGSGVGGGLVVDGAIYHGASPGEAEIGHVLLDRNGTKLEERCSGWAIDGRIRAAARQAPDSVLARSIAGVAEGGEAKHLAAAWRAQDAVAQKILSEHAEDLAFGLSHVVHLFHPQIIVLGGGLSSIGEPLRAGVEAALRRFIMQAFLPGPRIVLAQLGEDAVPVGALELAKKKRME